MTEQRFNCTVCGKCCYGWLPLTLPEALHNADKFPLAMTMTPVKPSEKNFKISTLLGTMVHLPPRHKIAVLVMPTAYIPPSMACPELTSENLCAIHENKPLRCRAMPFYPYREENHQTDMLVPRKGWLCDTTPTAPVVYRDKRILDRVSFDAERAALLQDAPALQAYADKLLKFNPTIFGRLIKVSQGRMAGRLILNFSSFLRIDQRMSLTEFALKQHGVLETWAEKTANDPALADYNKYYREACSELACFAQERPST